MTELLKNIVLATDFSQASLAAAKHARWLAKQSGAQLTVLHVFDPNPLRLPSAYFLVPEATMLLDEQLEKDHKAGQNALNAFMKDFPQGTKKVFIEGNPRSEIVAYAEQEEVDLLVLGAQGHSALEHLIVGSVTEFVTRHAPCHVLAIKSNASDEASAPASDEASDG